MSERTRSADGSRDPRAQTIWAAFQREGRVADHFARARSRFGGALAWSLIIPVSAPEVVARARLVQDSLGGRCGAEPIAADRLHVTLFTVAQEPPEGWLGTLREVAAATPEIQTAIGGVNAFPESVFLEVEEPEPIRALRGRVGEAAGWISGEVPSQFYLPHVSIAYFGEDGEAGDLPEALAALRGLAPIPVRMESLLASRLEFDETGRSRRLESHELLLGDGVEA